MAKPVLKHEHTYIGQAEIDLEIGKNVSVEYRVENDTTFKVRTSFFSNILTGQEEKNRQFSDLEFMLDFKSKKKVKFNDLQKMTDERINDLVQMKNLKYKYGQADQEKTLYEELIEMKEKMDLAEATLVNARNGIQSKLAQEIQGRNATQDLLNISEFETQNFKTIHTFDNTQNNLANSALMRSAFKNTQGTVTQKSSRNSQKK